MRQIFTLQKFRLMENKSDKHCFSTGRPVLKAGIIGCLSRIPGVDIRTRRGDRALSDVFSIPCHIFQPPVRAAPCRVVWLAASWLFCRCCRVSRTGRLEAVPGCWAKALARQWLSIFSMIAGSSMHIWICAWRIRNS